jgi:hypothetical protein
MTKKKTDNLDVVRFTPTPDMIVLKQKLLVRMEDSPIYSMAAITPEIAYEVTRDRRVKEWAKLPGFIDWLSNRSEIKEKVANLLDLALDRAARILSDDNPKAMNVQVGLIKAIIDLSALKASKEKDQSKNIDLMSEEQFEAAVAKMGLVRPTKATVIEQIPETIEMEGDEDES